MTHDEAIAAILAELEQTQAEDLPFEHLGIGVAELRRQVDYLGLRYPEAHLGRSAEEAVSRELCQIAAVCIRLLTGT